MKLDTKDPRVRMLYKLVAMYELQADYFFDTLGGNHPTQPTTRETVAISTCLAVRIRRYKDLLGLM